MARQNRKHRSDGFVFPAPLAGMLAGIAGVCLTYVGLNAKTESLAREIKTLESSRAELRRDLMKEEAEWAGLQLPANLDLALQAHGIEMAWPAREQIVRLQPNAGQAVLLGMRRPVRPAVAGKVAMND